MIGTQLGPYRIVSELGTGGMGTVYLAEHSGLPAEAPEERRRVAIKIVHPHLLETPGFFKRFMQEAEFGKRVRHENVVRTFDVDALMQEGQNHHFMVMEYVQGKSLRELLVDLGTIPETLLREIALQTAAGLCAIHSEGIIHRDLKPENILITDDHEIRIMDLGVAKLQEATLSITKDGQFAGSLLYAAPEQFRREDEVGPLADLYSLGVLLHELATGQHPFRSDDASAVIQAQLNEVPPPAHERNEDVSLFFSELIATLLAKQATGRFASAEELHAILAQGERSSWWTERGPALREQVARLPKIRVGRETKLHGRDEDLAVLRECFALASAAQGNTVLLEGEAGIGKTRLVDSFLRGLGGGDVHVLYGSYPPSGGIGGLSDAVIGKFGEARLADALVPYLTITPSLVPSFAALLKHESPPPGAETLGGDAVQAILVHLMRALAAEKPTIWIVDDLQFAPQESLGFLLALARAVEDHRILLIGTARPGLELQDFSRLENFRRIPLGRLGAREIIELLEDAFKSEALSEKLGVKIAKKSDGVPFFIFEMIRGLKEGQFIKQQPDGSYVQTQVIDAIEVPSAVKDLIEGRMRGLTEDQRAILDAGAVQGMTFEPALVARVLEEKKVRVLRQIAEIERRFGLVRGEATSCSFDQSQMQEVLYQDLLPELRSEYHTLLAEAHAERCGGMPKGDDAVFLAYHHLRGSRPTEALSSLEPALDHLQKGYRNDALLDLARHALQAEGLLEAEERVAVLLRQAGRLDLLGRREEQRAALDEAIALADETDIGALRAKVRQSLGALLHACSENDAALAVFGEARELARAAGDRELEATTTGNLGNVLRALGRLTEAQESHERSCALSREIGYRRGEAVAMGNLGGILNDLGHHAEAQEHFERARALNHEIGNRQGEAIAMGNLGIVAGDIGRYSEAQEYYERHRALSSEIGFRQGEAIATANLGNLFMNLGRYAEAREHHERARVLFREIGYRVGEAIATGNLGGVILGLGRHAEAREHYERCSVLSREIGYRQGEGDALAGLAAVAEAQDDAAQAASLHVEALALRRELGEKDTVAETLGSLGRLEAERGDTESATTHVAEALSLARETGTPNAILAATIEQARLPGGDVDAALAALEQHEERAGHTGKIDARFRLWEVTQDREHLDEAHRLLTFMREQAPEDCRDSMIENVPLHRDIMEAHR
ncbi:MAG: protein kinase domain-containing protein, partial [Planctomycetota bacterium]